MRLACRCFFLATFLFVVQLLSPVVSMGQSNASIHGTISDPSGAAIPGATIAVQQSKTAAAMADTHSESDGSFSISVPPGDYRVSISASGFSPVSDGVTVSAGDSRALDARLQLATMSSNVIVSAEAEPEPAANVIAPVDVLTLADIEHQQQNWLAPFLATAPGVALSQLGPEGGVESLFLDGGNSAYTLVLIDGVSADISLPGISIDFSGYTIDGIDKIEVVHGASSALYGSDAMTGVVDVLTHRGSTETPEVELEGEGGTFDTGKGAGQISGLLGKFDYSAAMGYFSTRGQSPGPDVSEADRPLAYPFFRDTTLNGNFGWKFSDTASVRLTVRNSASDAGQPGQTLLAADPSDLFDPITPGEDSDLHNFSSGLSWDFGFGEHWQTHFQGFDSRYQDTIADKQDKKTIFEFVDKFNRAGLDARSTYAFSHGGITAGYYFENETGGALGRHDNAGYLELRYQLTRRLVAIAGGRVEANETFGTRFVPRVGASYAAHYGGGIWGDAHLRASYGQGIKEPPLFPADCDPSLKAEQAATFDAGFDQYFASNRVRFSTTYFHNEFRNIVSFASGLTPNDLPQNCPAFFGSYFNTDKARAFGSDSSFSVRMSRWLDIGGTYSYDDSRVLQSPFSSDRAQIPGNRLLKRPLNSASLLVNVSFHGFDWNVIGYFVGRRTDSDFLSKYSGGVCMGPCITSNPGYVRWDTSAIVPLHYGVFFTAHIQNLFDKHYQDAIGYPALGYNYLVGIRYVWGGDR